MGNVVINYLEVGFREQWSDLWARRLAGPSRRGVRHLCTAKYFSNLFGVNSGVGQGAGSFLQ